MALKRKNKQKNSIRNGKIRLFLEITTETSLSKTPNIFHLVQRKKNIQNKKFFRFYDAKQINKI